MAKRRFTEDEPVMVSIRCITYNHAPYIRQCLEGFVIQKTNFRFQAVVHDDASTDGTTDIVREFAEKYPDIIVPMYEEENRWSKHDGTLLTCMLPLMTGKYIAECEGDDCWIDPYKLQKQVDYMELHPECNMCVHNGYIQYSDGSRKTFSKNGKDRDYTTLQLLLSRWIAPTASILFRGEYKLHDAFIGKNINSDIGLQYTKCLSSKIHFVNDHMCVYHYGTTGSSSARTSKKKLYDKKINLYLALNKASKYRYIYITIPLIIYCCVKKVLLFRK